MGVRGSLNVHDFYVEESGGSWSVRPRGQNNEKRWLHFGYSSEDIQFREMNITPLVNTTINIGEIGDKLA